MEWIRVEDDLPDPNQKVLATDGESIEVAKCHEGNRYWTYGVFLTWYEVTHWMPLPSPPKALP